MRCRSLLSSFVVLVACAAPPAPTDWGPTIRTANEELLQNGNLAHAREAFAPVYVAHAGGQDLSGGPEVVEGFVQSLRDAFSDIRVDVQVLVTSGDRVAEEWGVSNLGERLCQP